MAGAKLRLFIAVELPPKVVRHLTDIVGSLRAARMHGIRWVNLQGVHLTLKFLGSTPVEQVSPITGAISAAADGVPPFTVHVHGLGAFPGMHAPRVLWTAIQGDLDPLMALQRKVEEELERVGFDSDNRPFSPHLTLGRVRERLEAQDIERLARASGPIQHMDPVPLRVRTISLMESRLTGSGAVYRRKSRISLT